MWVVAGVLLGLVVLGSLVGFHTGPHTHAVAGLVGLLAAAWLVFMALDGRAVPLLWLLLGADLAVSAGVGVAAWSALSARSGASHRTRSIEAAEGVAVSDLTPQGIVRVRGEEWSAVAVNGTVRAGARVQVLRVAGVRLEVWGEEAEAHPIGKIVSLERGESEEERT